MKLIALINMIAVLSVSASVQWSFEKKEIELGGTFGVESRGEQPVFTNEVFSKQIFDGSTFTSLQENNQRSLYFKPTVVTGSVAPAGGELTVDGAKKELHLKTLTVEAFVRVEKQQKMYALIASKRRSNGCTWSMSVTPDGVFSVRLDTQPGPSGPGFNFTVSSGALVNDGLWHHVAMVFNHENQQCALYVDYKEAKSTTLQGPLVYDNGVFTIGRGLNGWIDEVRISDKPLHPEQFLRKTKFFSDSISKKKSSYPDVMVDLTRTRVQSPAVLDWKKIGTLKPKTVDEIPGDFWSLGCETLDRDLADWDAYKGYLKYLGIKRIRLQGGWNKTEKEKGVYDFEWLDHIVDSAHDLGIKVCLETSYGNRLYNPHAGLGPGGYLPAGEELEAWDKWVTAMVKHYQPKGVDEWMMYNEPNLKSKSNTVERIVANNGRTAAIIKSIDPDAKIGGLVCAGLNTSLIEKWAKGLKEKDQLKYFTWVIYHGYAANPDALNTGMRKAKAMLHEYSPTLKLWQGEAGCASEPVQYALSGVEWTELSHAKWNARRMLCDFGVGIESTVFTISDLAYHKNFISRYGLIKTNPDNSIIKVKTVFYVVNNIVSVFNDSVAINNDCKFEIEAQDKITRFAFKDKKSGYDLIAFWDGSDLPENTCELGSAVVKVENLKMDTPVWVDMLTSRIYEIPAANISKQGSVTIIKDVPYLDSPIALTDLSVLTYVEARKSKGAAVRKRKKKSAVKVAEVPMRNFKLFGSQKPAPAVIIVEGSGVNASWADAAAEWLRENEIHAFVLSGEKNSLKDAVKYLKSMSMAWSVDPKQIGVLGASSLTKSYKEAGANFVVNIDQPANADKKNTLFAVDANNDKFDLKALWLKDLLKWIEPRKTKVF
ncbi:MAG: beta-galactosidase [Kiritimatiellae bacterium]|jgi:hypothetical protein|nr:beta-galactosidase [Kiritimatiellia bacterium]